VPELDQTVKLLLKAFFIEYLQAFVPELASGLDRSSIEFCDRELNRIIGRRKGRRHLDILVKARFFGESTFILIHLEFQAQRDPEISRKTFLAFSRLEEIYALPIFPILMIGYRPTPQERLGEFRRSVRNWEVLTFQYKVVVLPQIHWQEFAILRNPAAAGLLGLMRMERKDRVRVMLSTLEYLANTRLEEEKKALIARLVENSLNFSPEEGLEFNAELAKIEEQELKNEYMQLMTSWERAGWTKGLQEGRQAGRQEGLQAGLQEGKSEGRLEMIEHLLARRFGKAALRLSPRIQRLTAEQQYDLADAVLQLPSLKAVRVWLDEALE
jgi:hypothetical protein